MKFIHILFICILTSCVASKQATNSTNDQKAAEKGNEKARIIFVNFKITKDSSRENSTVHITRIKIADGSLKKENLPPLYKPVFQNYLRLRFEDFSGKNIYETTIEHPLFKRFEYAKDDGSIESKNVVLKEAVFFVRTQYNPGMKYIRVFERLTSSDEKEIARLELNK
jgi:hypothetical protein